MQFGDDERAAAIQVGAVLLFGILIISMAMYQATVVPDQNKGVEFNHNQKVQGQMQDLRNTVVSVPSGGGGGSVTVDLGTTYPSRSLFVNPGPPYGSLRTAGTNEERVNVTIENANATDAEVRDFWDGSAHAFETGAIAYTPNYHEYENPPETVYEHSLLYNRFRGANLTITDQSLVSGDEITLVTLDGNLSESGMSAASVTADPVSASTTTVTVRNRTAPINITVATRLDRSTWEDALADETGSDGHVQNVYYESSPVEGYSLLTIELEPNVRYDLRMAKVGVGSGASEETGELYLTDVDGGGTVQTDGTQEVTVEVRDRYNNPVGDETVNFSADRGSVDESTVTTNGDGRASVTYNAPSSAGDDTVTADISASPSESERVEFDMTVESSGGGGGGSGAYTLQWDTSQIDATTDMTCHASNDTCVYDLQDGSSATMTANTSEPTSQVFVDFASNDTAIAKFDSPSHDTTDGSGEASKTLNLLYTGSALVSASAAEDGDALTVKVINRSSFPTADAGGPYAVDENDTVTLDGSNSTDAEGIDYYDWEITDDPTGNASITDADNTTPEAALEAPENVSSDTDVTVKLTVTDTDGNTDADPATVTVRDTDSDTTPPSISDFTATTPSGQDVEVSFDANEQLGSIEVDISGAESGTLTTSDFGETENADGTYTYTGTYAGSTDGEYNATLVTAEDTNGNDGANGESDTVVVDTTAPTISDATITDATDGDGTVTSGDTVLVEVTASDSTSGVDTVTANASDFGGPSSLELTDGDGDGVYDETFTVESNGSATDGQQSVDVSVTDGVGNSNSDTTNTLLVDTTSPSLTIDSLTDSSKCSGGNSCSGNNYAEYTVGWTASDANFDRVDVYFNNTDDGTSTAYENQAASDQITNRDTNDYGDSYEIKVVAYDTAGNSECILISGAADGNEADESQTSC